MFIKQFKFFFLLLALFVSASVLKAQPIPVELMLGNNYGVFELTFSKPLAQDSKIGFFHLSSVEFGYDGEYSSIILQEMLYVETLKNLRVVGGITYTPGGFTPSFGLHYIVRKEKFFFLSAPRINISDELSYDIINIIQYKIPVSEKHNLFTQAKLLNVFNSYGNIKSYQWFRVGLETKGVQFGLAVNLDERGPDPELTTNWGAFIRKEIF